jgi:uncharacterized surface protein with fasciclin (FAS1) repeats
VKSPPPTRKAAPQPVPSKRNLLETAASRGTFHTFARLVEAAGLSEALAAPGPFTVFAPTDEAFAGMPADRLDALLRPENKAELISLVNYHVLTGRKKAAELGRWDSARTVQGQLASFTMVGRQVSIDGARVTAADLDAQNGYLHGIDKVNAPK